MNKTFYFTLSNSSGHRQIAIILPYQNGMVVTNAYRPNLNSGSISFIEESFIDANEFENDCRQMVAFLNNRQLDLWNPDSYLDALIAVVDNHVRRVNRIFINDLMCYIDEISYIQEQMGKVKFALKNEYLLTMAFFIQRYGDLVKESIGVPVPFTQSNRFSTFLDLHREALSKANNW